MPVQSHPLSHSPMSGVLLFHFTDKETSAHGHGLGSHCPGPSPVSGSDGDMLGLSRTAGWAGEGEGQKVAEAPETGCPCECRRVQGEGSLVRAARVGLGPQEGVPGVLMSSHSIQWAAKCSCRASEATPTPMGCWGSGSRLRTPALRVRLQALLGKAYLRVGGSSLLPPHPEPTHLPEPTPMPLTLVGSRQGGRLPVSP